MTRARQGHVRQPHRMVSIVGPNSDWDLSEFKTNCGISWNRIYSTKERIGNMAESSWPWDQQDGHAEIIPHEDISDTLNVRYRNSPRRNPLSDSIWTCKHTRICLPQSRATRFALWIRKARSGCFAKRSHSGKTIRLTKEWIVRVTRERLTRPVTHDVGLEKL